jgi:hypothetical protein
MTNNLKAQGGGLRTNSVSLLRAVLIASLISFIANLIVPSTLSTAMAAGTSYTITWDGRGDTPSSGGSSTYTSGSAVALIPTTPPRYQGLAFKGWIAGNGTPITNGSYTPSADAGNITFYGVWTYANLQTRTPPVGQSVYSISCRAHEDRAGQMSRVNTTSSVLTAVGVGTTDARAMADPCAEAATYNISNDLVYWITPNTNANPRIKGSSLFELNYHTGVSTYIAELTPGTNVNGSDAQGRIFGWGITTDNRTGKMYVLYSDVSESDSTKFYVAEVNRQTGRLTNVFEVSGMCSGLESGQLTVSCSRTFWNESPAGGFAFNPVDSKFYVAVTASGDGFRFKLYRLNPSTGAAEFVSTSPVDRDWSNDNQLMVGISIDASGTIWSMNQRLASGTVAGFANTGDYLESSANTTFNTQTSFVAPSPGIYPCSVAGYFGVGENSANIVGGLSCEGEATIPAVPLPGGTPNEYRLALPAGARSVGVKSAALQNVNLKFASQSGAVNATFTTATVTTPPTFTPNVPGSYVDASLSGVSGATTVCLDGSATDRIYHFTAGAWVDITTSYSNGQVCGLTNSFSPFGVGARLTANVVNEAAKAAAAAAEVKREAEIKTARADISNKLAKSEKLTVDNFKQADIAGVTADNFAAVQAEILALPAQSRTDIKQVQKIARKYEVVGKVATEQVVTLPITAFVEVGLIPADSKNKVALIAAVKRAPATDRDSFVEIQAVIAAEAATIKDRKDRLAAAISRNKPK